MKRIDKIAGLLLTLSVGLLSACSDKTEDIKFQSSGVEVNLTVTPTTLWGQPLVEGSTSRAGSTGPIDSWYNTQVHMAYGQSSDFSSLGHRLALKGNVHGSMTTFSPQLFYPSAETIYMKGFYPRADALTSGSAYGKTAEVIVGNKIQYTIDGSYDIMVSNGLSGSSATPISGILTYRHLLTQFSFILVGNGSFPSSARVRKIELRNVRTDAVLDLAPEYNGLGHTDPSYPLTFTDSPTKTIVAFENSTGVVVPNTTPASAVGHIMFQPAGDQVPTFKIYVTIATANHSTGFIEDRDYPIDNLTLPVVSGDNSAKAGHHYDITLTFASFATGPAISATTTVVTPPTTVWPTSEYW